MTNKQDDPRLLTPEEIGDNLDLEVEDTYPCSEGSLTTTISVDKLLKAQLAKVLKHRLDKPEIQSRSVRRRIAAQKGEPAPDFSLDKPDREKIAEVKRE